MTEKEYNKSLSGNIIFYRSCLNLPKNITFGVEIEYENIVTDTVSELLKDRNDRCGDIEGWLNHSEIDIMEERNCEEINGEVSSPILIDEENTWCDLFTVLDILKDNGGIITEKCGGHIHIGTQILGKDINYWRNFLLLWILYNEEIYSFSSGEFIKVRPDNNQMFNKISDVVRLKDVCKFRKLSDLLSLKSLQDKYHDLYLGDIPNDVFESYNTIEIRVPNGSLDCTIWQNYINFFTKFMLMCKKEIDINEIVFKIKNNIHSKVELANLVFDDQIDKENFLIQSMKTNKKYMKTLPKHFFN